MGYSTQFTGALALSRKLTFKEARFLLEMNDDSDATEDRWAIRAYLQWVPTVDLDAIVWHGNEKFYDYTKLLARLCEWLTSIDVNANGELLWRGEDSGDIGTITVVNNVVAAVDGKKSKLKAGAPLTMESLAQMALEHATS